MRCFYKIILIMETGVVLFIYIKCSFYSLYKLSVWQLLLLTYAIFQELKRWEHIISNYEFR